MGTHQYTIRGIPEDLDRAIRNRADENGESMNQTAIDLLRHGIEMEELHHDLDWIQNSWKDDRAFDEAIGLQRKVDPDLWK